MRKTVKEIALKKTYKKLGFTGLEAVEVVNPLNVLLANYHIHYQKMRNFHWNVKGKDFFELHEKFEDYYNEAKINIDEIAERIRVFGQTPLSSLEEYLKIAEIKEVGSDLSSEQMVQEVLNDLQMLLSFMMNVTDASSTIGDVGTAEMINSFVKKLEKTHWMLTAWMNKN